MMNKQGHIPFCPVRDHGLRLALGDLSRSLSKSLRPGKSATVDAAEAAHIMPIKSQARHQAKVPAGRKSRPPNIAACMTMLTNNLKMSTRLSSP
jgi:hypothetical protein